MIVENVNFTINQGDRLNLVGRNGSGKSSIIKLIMNQKIDYQGQVIIGSNLKIAYLSQTDDHLQGRLDDFIDKQQLDQSLFKAILRKLDFSRDLFNQNIETFSKGQKRK
ncbi:ATP-binding cassette domain-containing protein [Coprobacillaceae bacterium CR2/5/TPMF4]|nr:ATP-binding cassette domain-containing protein [Coprobacillaceae bacterium CR2/5/TPMF4]